MVDWSQASVDRNLSSDGVGLCELSRLSMLSRLLTLLRLLRLQGLYGLQELLELSESSGLPGTAFDAARRVISRGCMANSCESLRIAADQGKPGCYVTDANLSGEERQRRRGGRAFARALLLYRPRAMGLGSGVCVAAASLFVGAAFGAPFDAPALWGVPAAPEAEAADGSCVRRLPLASVRRGGKGEAMGDTSDTS